MQRVTFPAQYRKLVKNTSQNTLRIIGGKLRSRRIEFPDLPGLRPTGDRLRETLFNWLQMDISDSCCLDLFAGSGALGFEAASRGARRVLMIDNNPAAIPSLQRNRELLQLDQVEVVCADGLGWLEQNLGTENRFDIVFLDPPFDSDLLQKSCEMLAKSKLLAEDCLLYLESSQEITGEQLPAEWTIEKSKRYGEVYCCLAHGNQ